jgi:hypothetical protein
VKVFQDDFRRPRPLGFSSGGETTVQVDKCFGTAMPPEKSLQKRFPSSSDPDNLRQK